jgi:excinuclease ABC subunit A
VFAGTPDALAAAPTRTGAWLRGEAALPERKRRAPAGPWLAVRGAREHNLADIDVEIPLRAMTAVTGVSGSGKSTLVHDVLYRGLAARMGEAATRGHLGEAVGEHDEIAGVEWLSRVALVDQSPIGKSPRSNPVTYVQAFDPLRRLFAATPAARRRGFGPGHFSFNTKEGQCPECKGDGHQRIEMHFLPDVFVTCDSCHGTRFRPQVLQVEWRGRSIADVLALTVEEAVGILEGEPAAARALRVLRSVGLGYLALGQPATTLSGGESQRLKIARELARTSAGRRRAPARGTLYLLDEPTTGLHGDDMRALVRVLDELVARGNTVVIVEHHLDMIARADWVVDLGPEGGAGGGRVVAAGPPEAVMDNPESHTGRALASRRAAREERLVGCP